MSDNSDLLQSLLTSLSSPNKTNKRKKTTPIETNTSMQNVMTNPVFAGLFSSLMQQMDIEVDELKENIVQKVLAKLGIDSSKLETLCSNGKGRDILASVDNLDDRKSHDFLIVHTYPQGNYGYIRYSGSYNDAKKHALLCLGKEHGMYNSLPDEEGYCVRKYPIYTLETEKVRIEVIPHASWISLNG